MFSKNFFIFSFVVFLVSPIQARRDFIFHVEQCTTLRGKETKNGNISVKVHGYVLFILTSDAWDGVSSEPSSKWNDAFMFAEILLIVTLAITCKLTAVLLGILLGESLS